MSNESTHTNDGGAGNNGGGGGVAASNTNANTSASININTNTPMTGTDLLNASSTTQVRPGGAPARAYLNEKVVPCLLEGMKSVTRDQPPDPLRALGEFLIQKSDEFEGGQLTNSNKSPD